jgi:membrane-associated protease RseP (regulator of RpoE activity)
MPDPTPPPSSTIEFYQPIEVFVVQPRKRRYWIHILLLLATIFTTLVVGARMEFNYRHNLPVFALGDELIPFFPIEWALSSPARLLLGIPFSAALLLILLTHEMGHYVYCRRYRVDATLPFFVPAPTLIGTMGAVIRIKSRIPSRDALFDIGIAGPIAGFVVAVITLAAALFLSRPMPPEMAASNVLLQYPLIFNVVHHILSAIVPAHSIAVLPLDRVYLHPTAVAAWVGMFATALNLLPSSQLDGGHIVYALWPRAHRYVSWITVLALVYLGRGYRGWFLWAGLIAAMNVISWRQRQAPDFPEIRGSRWVLALAALAMLALTITLVPIRIVGLD